MMKKIEFESIKDFEMQNLGDKATEKIVGGKRALALNNREATQEVTCTPKGNSPNDAD